MRLHSQFALPKRDSAGVQMPTWAQRRVGTVLVGGVRQLLYVTAVGLRLARVGKNGQAVTVREIKPCRFTDGALAGLRGQSLLQEGDCSWSVGVHTGKRVIRKFPDPVTRRERSYVGVVSLCAQVQGDEHYRVTYDDDDAEELDTPTLQKSLVNSIVPRDVCPYYAMTGECPEKQCRLRHTTLIALEDAQALWQLDRACCAVCKTVTVGARQYFAHVCVAHVPQL